MKLGGIPLRLCKISNYGLVRADQGKSKCLGLWLFFQDHAQRQF